MMKRLIAYILSAVLLLSGCSKGALYSFESQQAEEGINFPKNSFTGFCLDAFDKNGDGALSNEEVRDIRTIDCSGQNLTSVYGAGKFPSLDTLICDNNNISFINLSELTRIRYLSCKGNLIEELDLRDMSLGTLICNPMDDADGNNVLQYIYLRRGQEFETLDVPDATYVIELP